jgi:hypothetical protein
MKVVGGLKIKNVQQARDALQLGSMATQNSDNVQIDGGVINNILPLPISCMPVGGLWTLDEPLKISGTVVLGNSVEHKIVIGGRLEDGSSIRWNKGGQIHFSSRTGLELSNLSGKKTSLYIRDGSIELSCNKLHISGPNNPLVHINGEIQCKKLSYVNDVGQTIHQFWSKSLAVDDGRISLIDCLDQNAFENFLHREYRITARLNNNMKVDFVIGMLIVTKWLNHIIMSFEYKVIPVPLRSRYNKTSNMKNVYSTVRYGGEAELSIKTRGKYGFLLRMCSSTEKITIEPYTKCRGQVQVQRIL